MQITIINGSPRGKESASEILSNHLSNCLNHDQKINKVYWRNTQIKNDDLNLLLNSEVLIFVFPLYVDAIPAHLLHYLVHFKEHIDTKQHKTPFVYAIVNCGFFEGQQCEVALNILKNWTEKVGFRWGQGLGVGGGGMIKSVSAVPLGSGPLKNLGIALSSLSDSILAKQQEKNLLINQNLPWFLYKLAAELGWRKSIRGNGLAVKDLHRQITLEDLGLN